MVMDVGCHFSRILPKKNRSILIIVATGQRVFAKNRKYLSRPYHTCSHAVLAWEGYYMSTSRALAPHRLLDWQVYKKLYFKTM
jgi:hypothetical protein